MWFPERDPAANPIERDGYWGPWLNSTANKVILEKVLYTIPSVSEKKHSYHTNGPHGEKIGKVFSTHGESDKDVYQMLITMVNGGKKGQIPQNSRLMKESLAMLYAKMKQKTKVDDLMHKLQMIKKGRVAKGKGHKSEKSAKETLKPKKLRDKKHHKVDQRGTRRTEIENVAIKDESSLKNRVDENSLEKSSNSREENQNMEELSSLDENSGDEEVKQHDIEADDLLADTRGNDGNSEEESSIQTVADTGGQMSGEGSGMEFQESGDVSDDVNNDNDDSNRDDERNSASDL